jgi:molybdate transport system substrate-binding protein
MEELAKLYEEETGTKVEFLYGDSGTLLSQADLTGKGDIYICHDPFMASAQSKGLVDRDWTVGYLYPVIIVAKGNPQNIHSIRDLASEDLRIGLGDQRYSTCGNIITAVLEKAGLTERIEENVVLRARTSSEIANHLKMGMIDAGIIWDATAYRYRDEMDMVAIDPEYRPHPELDAVTTATFGLVDLSQIRITICSLNSSQDKKLARDFCTIVASDRGKEIFRRHRFSITKKW